MSVDKANIGQVQIALRISPSLRGRIKEAAERNNRSVNSELTATLEDAYPAPSEGDREMERIVQEALAAAGIIDAGDPRAKDVATQAVEKWIDEALERLGDIPIG